MERTAVEWLIEQWPVLESQIPETILNQAKEIFEKQIEEAFEKGFITTQWDKTKENKAEQYYIKTFKQT